MKNLINFISFVLIASSVVGQCPDITGKDILNKDQILVIKDLPYIGSEGESTQTLDLYIPAPYVSCPDAELILAIHGGGFEGGNKNGMSGWGYYYAKKGYCVAVINYRLHLKSYAEIEQSMLSPFLMSEVGSQCQELNEISFEDGLYKIDKAWYFAVQDSKAALAYLQNNLKERGRTIKKLMLLGVSAGAISALGLALGDQDEFNSYNPLLEKLYGPIDARVQYNLVPQKSIDAVISVSGGMINADYFISKEDTIPLVFLHGGSDFVVPLCEDNCYYSERRLNGPLRISELADSLKINIPIQMHFWSGEGHNLKSKFKKMTQATMGNIIDWPSINPPDKKLNLYPPSALLYNCVMVGLRDEIASINHFISENYEETGISVYPNPCDGTFTVNVPNMVGHAVSIRMYDPLGRLTLEKNVPLVAESEINVQASHVKSGIYELIIIEDSKEPVNLRIILN